MLYSRKDKDESWLASEQHRVEERIRRLKLKDKQIE
jgi:hypothetical protein